MIIKTTVSTSAGFSSYFPLCQLRVNGRGHLWNPVRKLSWGYVYFAFSDIQLSALE